MRRKKSLVAAGIVSAAVTVMLLANPLNLVPTRSAAVENSRGLLFGIWSLGLNSQDAAETATSLSVRETETALSKDADSAIIPGSSAGSLAAPQLLPRQTGPDKKLASPTKPAPAQADAKGSGKPAPGKSKGKPTPTPQPVSPTPQPAETSTPDPVGEPTPLPSESAFPETGPTPSPTAVPVISAVPTQPPVSDPLPTATPAVTVTIAPTARPTATPVPTVKPTATPVPTARPTATPAPTPRPTATPVPTPRPSVTLVPTPRPTATPVPTPRPTATPVPTQAPVSSRWYAPVLPRNESEPAGTKIISTAVPGYQIETYGNPTAADISHWTTMFRNVPEWIKPAQTIRVVIVEGNCGYLYPGGGTWGSILGFTYMQNASIYVSGNTRVSTTAVHETAHVYDFFADYLSYSDEFYSIYLAEGSKLPNNLKQTFNQFEFFAEGTAQYLLNPSAVKASCPRFYQFMETLRHG